MILTPRSANWDRRRLLRNLAGGLAGGLATAALARATPAAYAAQGADSLVIVLSDLHSAYARYPAMIAALDTILARHAGVPALIVVNGDIFERANAVALRTAGEADLAFIRALGRRAPTVVNLGNHETALVDDMAAAVQAIRSTGAAVVTSIRDKRTGTFFAPPRAEMRLGTRRFTVAGLATDTLATYRAAAREVLDIPAPAPFARASHRDALTKAEFPILVSHAGVAADRDLLPDLPDGTLIIGGHDHLRLVHRAGNRAYLHSGSYLGGFAVVATTRQAGRPSHAISLLSPERQGGDRALAGLIQRLTDQHLTEAERMTLARFVEPAPLGEAARFLTRAMAKAAEADVGLINHTTLGAAIDQGAFTAHDLANFIRFDGAVFVAEIDGAGLSAILDRANQDREMPLAERTGDFLYATPQPLVEGRRYRITTNGWVAQNARRYLGRDDLSFREVPDRMIRAAFVSAL